MRTTQVVNHIRAARSEVYRALLDADSVRGWMVPDQMTSRVHSFDARKGGSFRISLTYDTDATGGKTDARTDSFHGRFVRLVPDSKVVQSAEFETDDPAMRGEMTITYTLADVDAATVVVGTHEHVPTGVSLADNELGWTMSLDKLGRLRLLSPRTQEGDDRHQSTSTPATLPAPTAASVWLKAALATNLGRRGRMLVTV